MPAPDALRRICQSLAVLDAIISPEWEYRYYSFNSEWSSAEQMASMRNGQGDHWFALFANAGVAIHGLAHESPMFTPGKPWPGVFDDLPSEFRENFLLEPAFDTRNSTFCIWRLAADQRWNRGELSFAPGEDPDGSAELLSILKGRPEQYVAFADEYYEVDLPIAAVEHVYRHGKLTDELVKSLNPELTLEAIESDVREIAYRAG